MEKATSSSASAPAGEGAPAVAAALTWLVPGAGHLYLGRTGWAIGLFVLIEGLYALGFLLADGMTFQYLDPELRSSRLAPVLSPEIGNLGAFLYQLRDAFGEGDPAPWPAWMRLGSVLCAASGVLNVCAIVLAHTAASDRSGAPHRGLHPAAAVAATWVCPGLGHLLQGRRLRGLMVFVMLVGLFALGTWLAEGSNLSRERHFYYWAGQFLLGGPALVAEALWGTGRVTHEIPYADAGLVFGCVAGLLNALVMIDAYAWSEARWLGRGETGAAVPAPLPEVSA